MNRDSLIEVSTRSLALGGFSLAITVIAICQTAEARRGPPPSSLPGAKSVEAVERMVMPEVDVDSLLAEDAEREGAGRPVPARYAKGLPVVFTPANSGTWEELNDDSWLWRLRIASPGALSLSLGLKRFDLPNGAAFWVHDPDRAWVQGPYTAENRNALDFVRIGATYTFTHLFVASALDDNSTDVNAASFGFKAQFDHLDTAISGRSQQKNKCCSGARRNVVNFLSNC